MDKNVVELFAGVGGFRVGLNNVEKIDENGHAIENGDFHFVWSNQREPSTKTQHAFDCYNLRFPGDFNSNIDISLVNKKDIPNHSLKPLSHLLIGSCNTCVPPARGTLSICFPFLTLCPTAGKQTNDIVIYCQKEYSIF